MRWTRDAFYIFIALAAWALTAYAYYYLLEAMRPSRSVAFFVSMGLALAVMLAGLAFEDRVIWKGYFDGPFRRDDVLAGGRRTAPPPLMMGVIGGLLIFFFWHP